MPVSLMCTILGTGRKSMFWDTPSCPARYSHFPITQIRRLVIDDQLTSRRATKSNLFAILQRISMVPFSALANKPVNVAIPEGTMKP